MKITKLKCDKLAQTPIATANKSFLSACRNIAALHPSRDLPTGYLFIQEQAFKGSEKGALLLLGDLTTAWLKFAKGIKANAATASTILFGQCFAEEKDGKLQVVLMNKAGKMKLKAVVQPNKALLNKANVEIIWDKGLSDDSEESTDTENQLLSETLDDQENDQVEDYLEEEDGTQDTDWSDLADDAFDIKTLLEQTSKSKKPEIRSKNIQELRVRIPAFLTAIEAGKSSKGNMPPKLNDFYAGLQPIWQRLQASPAETPQQKAVGLVKKAFQLFSALKA